MQVTVTDASSVQELTSSRWRGYWRGHKSSGARLRVGCMYKRVSVSMCVHAHPRAHCNVCVFVSPPCGSLQVSLRDALRSGATSEELLGLIGAAVGGGNGGKGGEEREEWGSRWWRKFCSPLGHLVWRLCAVLKHGHAMSFAARCPLHNVCFRPATWPVFLSLLHVLDLVW